MHTFADTRTPTERLVRALTGAFAALFLLGIGLWLIDDVVRTERLAAASEGWQPTAGRVVVSRVVEEHGRRRGDVTHDAHVAYEYEVGGRGYRSDRVRIGGLGLEGRDDAERASDRYPWGAAVTVYYDPADPGSAVLVRGMRPFARIAGPALVALLWGVALACAAVTAPAWRAAWGTGDAMGVALPIGVVVVVGGLGWIMVRLL